MKLLALAVLLAVMQTSAPVPRKAADPSNRAAQNVESNSGSHQSPSQQPQTIMQPISPKPDANDSHSPAADNTPKTIVIRELPPVSVTKDRLDKLYIFFTGVLILIGGLGVWAAYRTLRAIPLYTAQTGGKGSLPPYETRMCFYYGLHTGEGMVICGNENYNRQT